MISYSLLKKIFCCIVGSFLIIGIPVFLTQGHLWQQESARPEKIDVFKHLFPEKKVPDIIDGDTFSNDQFQDWQPSVDQQKYIATNWQNIIPNMPIKFFEPYSSIFNTKLILTTPDTCYLRTNYVTDETKNLEQQNQKFIYAPFSKNKLTSTLKNKPAWSREYDNKFLKLGSPEGQQEINKSDSADISLFDDLYDETSKHFKKLGISTEQNHLAIWFFDSGTCSAD